MSAEAQRLVREAIRDLPDGSAVLAADGHVWTVCRDGGMVTRADYAGPHTMGIVVFLDLSPHKILYVPGRQEATGRMEAESAAIVDAVLAGSGFLHLTRDDDGFRVQRLDPTTVTLQVGEPT